MPDRAITISSRSAKIQSSSSWRVPGSYEANPLIHWQLLADWLESNIGYHVEPEKYYLLESKILPLVEELQIMNLDQLIAIIDRDQAMRQLFINAVTINETFFFRESSFWASLANEVIPHIIQCVLAANRGVVNILICACSRGQEVWSLAMLLDERSDWSDQASFTITATDIDDSVLATAKAGTYTKHDIQRGLSPERINRHLQPDGAHWRVRSHLRNNIHFRTHNLMEEASGLGRFDLILCRNVLIYFTQPTKELVLKRLSQSLSDDGAILIGGCETISSSTHTIRRFRIGSAPAYQ